MAVVATVSVSAIGHVIVVAVVVETSGLLRAKIDRHQKKGSKLQQVAAVAVLKKWVELYIHAQLEAIKFWASISQSLLQKFAQPVTSKCYLKVTGTFT